MCGEGGISSVADVVLVLRRRRGIGLGGWVVRGIEQLGRD